MSHKLFQRCARFIRDLSTRLILITVCALIFIHLVILGVYTHQHRLTSRLARHDAAIQQVMNLIHMIKATPKSELKRAIATLNISNIDYTMDDKPKWKTQAKVLTYWRISHLFPKKAKTIELSLHLTNGKWLNIRTSIQPETFWLQLFLFLLEIIVVLTIVFYVWSINRFKKPLKQFQKAANRLGVDINTPTQLEEYNGPQVVRDTAQAMNKMQQRITDLLRDRTLMIAAISHDLRTPITRLKLRADKIVNHEIQKKTLDDLNEMDTMIGEILSFAKNDYTEEEKVKLDLNSFVKSLCDEMADMGHPVYYHYHAESDHLPFKAKRLALKRALENLINNAIKYGEEATVHLKQTAKHILITIEDRGPGILENELDKVFNPFYRCDHSRSRKIAGTGLGLTVAHSAIISHGGSIILRNKERGGLCATIQFSFT